MVSHAVLHKDFLVTSNQCYFSDSQTHLGQDFWTVYKWYIVITCYECFVPQWCTLSSCWLPAAIKATFEDTLAQTTYFQIPKKRGTKRGTKPEVTIQAAHLKKACPETGLKEKHRIIDSLNHRITEYPELNGP